MFLPPRSDASNPHSPINLESRFPRLNLSHLQPPPPSTFRMAKTFPPPRSKSSLGWSNLFFSFPKVKCFQPPSIQVQHHPSLQPSHPLFWSTTKSPSTTPPLLPAKKFLASHAGIFSVLFQNESTSSNLGNKEKSMLNIICSF